MGKGRGHRHLDAADADADQGTDFQQLQANRVAGGLGELGMGEAEPAMLDVLRRSAVREAAGEPIDQPDRPRPKAARRHPMSRVRHRSRPPPDGPRRFQNQTARDYTLSASGTSVELADAIVANRLLPVPSPDAATSCEKCGLEPNERSLFGHSRRPTG